MHKFLARRSAYRGYSRDGSAFRICEGSLRSAIINAGVESAWF
jgi:hypothetical protein